MLDVERHQPFRVGDTGRQEVAVRADIVRQRDAVQADAGHALGDVGGGSDCVLGGGAAFGVALRLGDDIVGLARLADFVVDGDAGDQPQRLGRGVPGLESRNRVGKIGTRYRPIQTVSLGLLAYNSANAAAALASPEARSAIIASAARRASSSDWIATRVEGSHHGNSRTLPSPWLSDGNSTHPAPYRRDRGADLCGYLRTVK